MVASSRLQRRRSRPLDTKPRLAARDFTTDHRDQILAGTLILRSYNQAVMDIQRRADGRYVMMNTHRQLFTIHSYDTFEIIHPAIPKPLPPFYDVAAVPAPAEYQNLSLPMRRALDTFAWSDWNPRPHPNTVRALEKRGIVFAGKITLYGGALYRAYGRFDKELKNG